MAVIYTESFQLGTHARCYRRFEETLLKMARHHCRPAPELRGAQVHDGAHELSWLVVCTIRPPLLSQSDPEITYEVMESSWEDGKDLYKNQRNIRVIPKIVPSRAAVSIPSM